MKKTLSGAIVAGLLLGLTALVWAGEKATTAKGSGLVAKGQKLYEKNSCKVCHMIAGKGGKVGGDLSKEGAKEGRNEEWHLKHFKDPKSVVPNSKMPATKLGDEDLKALAAYLMSLK